MSTYEVVKTLNNNVVVAKDDIEEVILIGKGIGFNKKMGSLITEADQNKVEKIYELKGYHEQERYKTLVHIADDNTLKVILEVVNEIDKSTRGAINDDILLSLTDHIIFAMKRLQDGIQIANPFLQETKALYPREFEIAEFVVALLNEKLGVTFPYQEVGFIALHIHSSINNHTLHEMSLMTEVVTRAVHIIEHDLKVQIDKESLMYTRFVRHISFAVQRVMNDDRVPDQTNLDKLLKIQYPFCYSTAVKIVKMMQTHLKKPVYESELVYLTMHIQHFNTQTNDN